MKVYGMVLAAHGHISMSGQRQAYPPGYHAPERYKREASDTERIGYDTNPTLPPEV